MLVERDGRDIQLQATPKRVQTEDAFGNSVSAGRLGIAPHIEPLIGYIRDDSVAQNIGMELGDIIKRVDGIDIQSYAQMDALIRPSYDRDLQIVIDRDGQELTFTARPDRIDSEDSDGKTVSFGTLGIAMDPSAKGIRKVQYPLSEAVAKGVSQTWFIIDRTVVFLARLFQGKEDAGQISGPLRIAQISGQVADNGLVALINLAALLSVSIGFINLLPIPMLDGGHLLFYGYEAVAGKPLNERAQDYGFRIGIALVLSMMVFATWNDLVHLLKF